jgi:hypothetical protein
MPALLVTNTRMHAYWLPTAAACMQLLRGSRPVQP